jgi:chain length determinant protein EpsF
LLALNDDSAPQKQWPVGRLQGGLSIAQPKRDSTILSIEYPAVDPEFAAAAANAFAQAYVETTVELMVEPSKQYALWFGEQTKSMRENLEKAQLRLSQYQQQKGIVVTDEKVDLETDRLVELTAQLSAVQAQVAESRSKQRSGIDAPDVAQNSLVQTLRGDVARVEARLKVAAGNLGRNHPEYRSMESELAELKARLEAETRLVTRGFSASRAISSDRERELTAAIEAQKRKLLELRSERDRVAVLQRDLDAAKNAYDGVAKRYSQTSLESKATHTNVSVLTPAAAPLEPNGKTNRYALLAILMSVILGLTAAFGIEKLDRRIRGADDLAEMLQMPVLAVVKRGKRRSGVSVRRRGTPMALR